MLNVFISTGIRSRRVAGQWAPRAGLYRFTHKPIKDTSTIEERPIK